MQFIKKISLTILLLFPALAFAQYEQGTRGGLSLGFDGEKRLSHKIYLGFSQEFRLAAVASPYTETNSIFSPLPDLDYDRSITSVGLDYSIIAKRLKAGVYYTFLYVMNNDYLYEPRHRMHLSLTYKHPFAHQWSVSWQAKGQVTLRDEERGDYRVNPRFVLKNRFKIDYQIWGKPFKPFLTVGTVNYLNDDRARYDFQRLRTTLGIEWRINRTNFIDFFGRWDEYLTDTDPRVISLGVNYKMDF